MRPPAIQLGDRHGRLVAIEESAPDRHGKRRWLFQCDCGQKYVAVGSAVKRGSIKSCGCFNNELRAERASKAGAVRGAQMRKHGHAAAGTPEYAVWKSMRQRCSNPNTKDYPAYGGRGIRVCARWNRFEYFLADMGRRPDARYSIDRINPNGDYTPENCRWADDFEQAANRRQRGTGEYANPQE